MIIANTNSNNCNETYLHSITAIMLWQETPKMKHNKFNVRFPGIKF